MKIIMALLYALFGQVHSDFTNTFIVLFIKGEINPSTITLSLLDDTLQITLLPHYIWHTRLLLLVDPVHLLREKRYSQRK